MRCHGGWSVTRTKLKKILQWSTLLTVSHILQSLGLCSYNQVCIHGNCIKLQARLLQDEFVWHLFRSSFHLLNKFYISLAHPIFLEIIVEFKKEVKDDKDNEMIHAEGLMFCLEMIITHISYDNHFMTLIFFFYNCENNHPKTVQHQKAQFVSPGDSLVVYHIKADRASKRLNKIKRGGIGFDSSKFLLKIVNHLRIGAINTKLKSNSVIIKSLSLLDNLLVEVKACAPSPSEEGAINEEILPDKINTENPNHRSLTKPTQLSQTINICGRWISQTPKWRGRCCGKLRNGVRVGNHKRFSWVVFLSRTAASPASLGRISRAATARSTGLGTAESEGKLAMDTGTHIQRCAQQSHLDAIDKWNIWLKIKGGGDRIEQCKWLKKGGNEIYGLGKINKYLKILSTVLKILDLRYKIFCINGAVHPRPPCGFLGTSRIEKSAGTCYLENMYFDLNIYLFQFQDVLIINLRSSASSMCNMAAHESLCMVRKQPGSHSCFLAFRILLKRKLSNKAKVKQIILCKQGGDFLRHVPKNTLCLLTQLTDFVRKHMVYQVHLGTGPSIAWFHVTGPFFHIRLTHLPTGLEWLGWDAHKSWNTAMFCCNTHQLITSPMKQVAFFSSFSSIILLNLILFFCSSSRP
ncbi:putative signal peptide protein [Puccinia sorghi]|uniref:Putative signal peptide protein n=1 Tax=Puccinia sorghi TaxID=27349 RepID=A0A0L6VRK8_9BASI|nr:putative signal peptide protein [Puccinia sorghi]